MKIVLNIKELLEEGQIDQTEYDKLLLLSKRQTIRLAFNLLLGFGIVATSIGAIALAPSPYSCFIFGLIVSVIGLLVKIKASDQWMVLSITCLISGVLMNIVSDLLTSNCFGVTGFGNSSINCLNVFISYHV